MNEFLTGLLVQFWNKFKVKNAKVATAILVIVGGIVWFANQGTLAGIITLPEWAASFITYLGSVYLLLMSPHTSSDMAALQGSKEG
jgi:hypothetical protein